MSFMVGIHSRFLYLKIMAHNKTWANQPRIHHSQEFKAKRKRWQIKTVDFLTA